MQALMQRNDALSVINYQKNYNFYFTISSFHQIMNVSNVAEFRLENSTFVAEEKGRSDDKLKYLAILFGTVTLLTNGILFIMMLLKRPMKKIDKLTAVIAMGSAPLGLAYMISNIQKLVMRSAVRNITSLQCLMIAPQLTLYMFAEPVISYALLLMAMDSFIALMFMNSRWKVDDNNINFYLVLSVILPCICVITLWVVVYYNDRLCADCSIPVVLPQWFFVSFNSVLAFLGYLSVLLFSVAGVGFNLRKSTCTGVRLIQIRRQITILKQTAITVAFSFMIQTVPCTCSVWFAFNKGSPVINQYGWLVCNASYSLYAIYRILRAPAVRRQCQKWFCCKTDQPVASSMVKVVAYSAGEGNKHSSTLPENLCCRRAYADFDFFIGVQLHDIFALYCIISLEYNLDTNNLRTRDIQFKKFKCTMTSYYCSLVVCMHANWSVEEESEQSPFQPIVYENSDKTMHHLCIQGNFRHTYNLCMEYVTEAIKREEETFNINILQLVFGIICIISNGMLLHLFALRSAEKKAYSLQQGFYFGCMLNGFAYVGYLGRRFAVGKRVCFIRSIFCVILPPYSILFSISDIHMSVNIFFIALDCFTAVIKRKKMFFIVQSVIQHSWKICIFADICHSFLLIIQCLTKKELVLTYCWYYEIVCAMYFKIHLAFIALCDIFAIALYVASSIAILFSRSTYSCVRKIQIKRQIVVMKQIILMVLFAVFCQLIPYTFVLITQFFDLNKKYQWQIYMWTIQPVGLSIAPLCRLFTDSKLLSAMKNYNPLLSSVLKSKMKSSSSNHVMPLNLKCKVTPK
ncbi:hypothetical protein T03_1889 [Trichinella britovi]|uniref:Uncharacterized protein n=1 Tax=Trichinella britovi TaxID=45882 RepID=A0A0V1CLX5_TRIBR|nr:hypothetical protein T03_1889 [Trichinella britovi]